MKQRVILAGGSGFLGTALAREFMKRGYEVVVLTRQPKALRDEVREISWDGKTVGDWTRFLDEARAIINLAGKNINCLHTPENLREITNSRVDSVNTLNRAVTETPRPPKVWIQASAVGYYGDSGGLINDENASSGNDALATVCRDWEAAFNNVKLAETRKVVLRIGFVLGREGGGFPVMAGLTKKFLGGAAGNGRQYMSWIHLADLAQMFVATVERGNLNGTFNAVAPNPVTNNEFMRELRGAMHRPWSPPVPVFALKLGARLMGTDPSLALVSQRCVPKRFLDSSFQFQFSQLRPALDDLCR